MKYLILVCLFVLLGFGLSRGLIQIGSTFDRLSIVEGGRTPWVLGFAIAFFFTGVVCERWVLKKKA